MLITFMSHMCFYLYVALDLIEHLRSMGETNALLQKSNVRFFSLFLKFRFNFFYFFRI